MMRPSVKEYGKHKYNAMPGDVCAKAIRPDSGMGQQSDPVRRQGGKAARPGRRRGRNGGFSLVQVSILLTVAALVMVSMLPGQEAGNSLLKAAATVERLQKIERATTGFMAAYGRRPCPADGQYGVDTANFGIEAGNPGSCVGGTPAAPFGPDAGTGYIVGGTVPTKTLGLSDDYAFDEWGRRITYVVDKRVTARSGCIALQNYPLNNGKGGITIKDASGGSVIANVMAAYISHGGDGHGAFPMQGSTVANRINIGSIDADTLVNAGVDGSFTYSAANFTNVKIQKEKTATYDDLTYYADYQKNRCCAGSSCIVTGFRVDGESAGLNTSASIAVADINGDNIDDLIIASTATYYAGYGSVYVLLGGSSLPSSASILNTGAGNLIDGVHGFRFDGPSTGFRTGASLAVADVNGDGIKDIVVGAGNNGGAFVIWGTPTPATTWSATQTLDTAWLAGGGAAVRGMKFNGPAGSGYFGSGVAVADINGDGKADIVIGDTDASPGGLTNAGTVYVIWGKASGWATTQTVDTAWLAGNGMAVNGFALNGEAANEKLDIGFRQTGDFNGDGKDDLLLVSPVTTSLNASARGAAFLIYGKNAGWATTQTVDANWLSGNHAGCPPGSLICTASPAVNGFRLDGHDLSDVFGSGVGTMADVNGDGKQDLILPHWGWVDVIWGGSSPSVQATQRETPTFLAGGGTALVGTRLSIGSYSVSAWGADMNGDGFADILIGIGSLNGNVGGGYVIWGKASGWATTQTVDSTWLNTGGTGANGFQIDGVAANDRAGNSCAMGDLNGDGVADLVLGAYSASPNGLSNAGSGYVLYGSRKAGYFSNPFPLSKID